jgi:hypothetical protein
VFTATLVSPRIALVLSVNVTKMRLLVGSNGTVPLAVTKAPKVGGGAGVDRRRDTDRSVCLHALSASGFSANRRAVVAAQQLSPIRGPDALKRLRNPG